MPKKFENYFEECFSGLKVIRNKQLNSNIEYNVEGFDSMAVIKSKLRIKLTSKYDFPNDDKNVSVVFCRTINLAQTIGFLHKFLRPEPPRS